jgi:hypothetical protein
MKKLKIWATVAFVLGILALILLLFMFLARMDITHGEQDLTAEWGIVRAGFFVIFFLIVATFVCTGLIFKYFRDRSDEDKLPSPH